jgi:hypothetical protein
VCEAVRGVRVLEKRRGEDNLFLVFFLSLVRIKTTATTPREGSG